MGNATGLPHCTFSDWNHLLNTLSAGLQEVFKYPAWAHISEALFPVFAAKLMAQAIHFFIEEIEWVECHS